MSNATQRYVIVSDELGVFTGVARVKGDEGTLHSLWTNSAIQPVEKDWNAPTYTKEEGEKELKELAENKDNGTLRLVECTADVNPDKHGRPHRASRTALAARGLVPSPEYDI